MSREFRYPYTDEFEFTVEVAESGQPYVERETAGRVAWMVMGLFVVGVTAWFVVSYEGPEGWLLSTAVPAVIGLFALAGVVSEPIFGSDRSRVHEVKDRYYLEMLTCSRWYVAAAGVAIAATGVSMFLSIRSPGLVEPVGPRRGSGMVSLAESLPFGEFVLLFVAVVLAVVALQKAVEGRLLIVPK